MLEGVAQILRRIWAFPELIVGGLTDCSLAREMNRISAVVSTCGSRSFSSFDAEPHQSDHG